MVIVNSMFVHLSSHLFVDHAVITSFTLPLLRISRSRQSLQGVQGRQALIDAHRSGGLLMVRNTIAKITTKDAQARVKADEKVHN